VGEGDAAGVAGAEAVGWAEPVGAGAGDGAHALSAVPAATGQHPVVIALRSIGLFPRV
jgi:hypothetical protein